MNIEELSRKVYDKATAPPTPWNDSVISGLLQELSPKMSEKLALDSIARAVELRREYGQHGDEDFSPLIAWSITDRFQVAKFLLTERKNSNYKALVDYLAVLILCPGGTRIGDKQLCIWLPPKP